MCAQVCGAHAHKLAVKRPEVDRECPDILLMALFP